MTDSKLFIVIMSTIVAITICSMYSTYYKHKTEMQKINKDMDWNLKINQTLLSLIESTKRKTND